MKLVSCHENKGRACCWHVCPSWALSVRNREVDLLEQMLYCCCWSFYHPLSWKLPVKSKLVIKRYLLSSNGQIPSKHSYIDTFNLYLVSTCTQHSLPLQLTKVYKRAQCHNAINTWGIVTSMLNMCSWQSQVQCIMGNAEGKNILCNWASNFLFFTVHTAWLLHL